MRISTWGLNALQVKYVFATSVDPS